VRIQLPGRAPRLRGSIAIVTGVLAVTGLLTYGGAAGAAPQPDVTQIRQQVNDLTSRFDQANQQYDAVAQQLSAARARLSRLGTQAAAEQASFQKSRTKVAQIAAANYESGNMTSIAGLLTSSNPQAVLSQASLLLQMSGSRNQQMKQFLAQARQLSGTLQQEQRAAYALAALKTQRGQQKQHAAQLLSSKKATLASLTTQQQQAVAATSIGAGGTTVGAYTGPTSTQAGKAIAFAYSALGTPYVWGGTGPGGYDCSGLVQAAWAAAGVSIPRDTYQQWAALPHIATSAIEPGDLLFYDGIGHVAMYIGNGQIIDAPRTGLTVERLPMNTSWYSSTFVGAARP
jgi:cell wall-associated NlpC family hydrolase